MAEWNATWVSKNCSETIPRRTFWKQTGSRQRDNENLKLLTKSFQGKDILCLPLFKIKLTSLKSHFSTKNLWKCNDLTRWSGTATDFRSHCAVESPVQLPVSGTEVPNLASFRKLNKLNANGDCGNLVCLPHCNWNCQERNSFTAVRNHTCDGLQIVMKQRMPPTPSTIMTGWKVKCSMASDSCVRTISLPSLVAWVFADHRLWSVMKQQRPETPRVQQTRYVLAKFPVHATTSVNLCALCSQGGSTSFILEADHNSQRWNCLRETAYESAEGICCLWVITSSLRCAKRCNERRTTNYLLTICSCNQNVQVAKKLHQKGLPILVPTALLWKMGNTATVDQAAHLMSI